MAKFVGKLKLDQEVADLVSRIGALGHPQAHINRYAVSRDVNGVTEVTVTFIADEHFSREEEK